MNLAAQRQQLAQKMELLQLLLTEHPDNDGNVWGLSELHSALDASISKISNSFPEHILKGHFWFDTIRKEHIGIKDGKPYTYFDNKGGTIVCRLVTEPEKEYRGRATCMPIDTFNGVFGRTIALFRARTAAYKEQRNAERARYTQYKATPNIRNLNKPSEESFRKRIVDSIAEIFTRQHGL